ncbi:ABC transporter ATP-binding protein [Microgenomates group bacterium]|nr:ABC transporter ATP-binding protein [Microgenomates group bacterium]
MKSPIIRLKNVSKTYFLGEEPVKAICNISLEIYAQEYISILGTSGCGKSTLMYLIGLLETPSQGKIYLNNRNISQLNDVQLSCLRNETIGFIFQSFNLINKYTVLENVILPTVYSRTRLNFNPLHRALDLLKKFGIFNRKDFFPNKISGGEQQRVAIARALIMNPKIILADEPTGNLDSKTGQDIMKIIGNLNRDFNTTVITVTHDHSVAKQAQKLIYLKDGYLAKKYL